MKFSETIKNIIIFLFIFIAAILSIHYGLNINGYLDQTNEVLNNDEINKKQVQLDKCIDGDTAKVIIDDKSVKIRFLAIDTPEVNYPKKDEESYGKTASSYTCKLLANAKKIEIAYEKNLVNKDKYNRHLVWIWVDDELLQEKLIDNSLARVKYIYAKYTYTNRLLKLQKQVQKQHIGIWHNYNETSTKETYFVIFKLDDSSKTVEVKNNYITTIIDNPVSKGKNFKGWSNNNKLYDLSQKITENIILEPIFE